MAATYATGDTLPSEESDENSDDEIQSQEIQSQEHDVQCSPTDPIVMSTTVYDTWQQARASYNRYAKKMGFSIKIGSSKKKDKEQEEPYKVVYFCNKNGSNTEQKADQPLVKQRKRDKTVRTACPARFIVNRRNDKWHVTTFVEEHNHPLCEKFDLKKFLRSHRGIPDEEKHFVELLHGTNISAGRVMEIMAKVYEGRKAIPYVTKDVSNLKAKLSRGPQYKDMSTTLSFFEELKQNDPNLYCKFDLDLKDRVRNLFWVDGAAREMYKEFGDCISFDMTYMTNRYKMPFAPFIGINNHGQTIQLGCGFMKDETIESFTWLFKQFLDAMGGVPPATIITDQDPAMAAAIAAVFPNAVHRNCRFHIVVKVQGPLSGYMKKKPGLANRLNACMDFCVTGEEFEMRWASAIQEHSAHGNKMLEYLFDLRKTFIPAYYMQDFFPFLQTTARSEGFNAVLKKYVNPQMSILNFVQQYMKIQDKISSDEDGNDFSSEERVPGQLFSGYPIEEQASKFYTRKIFYRFQNELKLSTSYKILVVSGCSYTLTPTKGYVFGYGERDYMVYADVGAKVYICECSKMKRDGIPCCHILKIMTQEYILEIPPEYLLNRWSNDAAKSLTYPAGNETIAVQQVESTTHAKKKEPMKTIRYVDMCAEFAQIATQACSNEKTTSMIRKHMEDMKEDLKTFKARNSKRQKTSAAQDEGQPQETFNKVKYPPMSKPKGRPISSRRKPGCRLEEKKKKEKCGRCGSKDHTSDHCPNLLQ
ncbi:unnamed protein product [Urochloa humidicola]